MAVYAALLSLMTTLNNIQIHPRVSTFFNHQHIQSLHQISNSLLHFMESSNSDGGSRDEEEALERRIASTAHAAEDVIESHVVDQIVAGSTHLIDLETQIKDMNSLKEMMMVMEFQGKLKFEDKQSSPASSKPLTTAKKDFVVGFEEKVIQVMDRLTRQESDLRVVPIVGMGGIGKTTLAQSVYNNLLTVESFDIRAWVTVSLEYSLKNVLCELLSCIKGPETNVAVDFETGLETEDHKLGLQLYQTLWGRRYLIVLDDMWSLDAWNEIKCFFPNSGDRSRVVVTTRMSSVATQLSSSSFDMNFLDEDQSWELFCMNVFLEKSCPHELEEIGKKIVRDCKGLPLSIVVIGGLLRNFTSTCEYWENFARDLNSILISGNDEHCLKILSLSYNQLPGHLKPCFLYMGVFKEDEKIHVSKLIKLLVAEGFLKPKEDQTLEEVAYDYLNDLVDRNLVIIDSWRWNGRVRYCKMHDLVREVCLKIGEREKIFHRMKILDIPVADNNRERRIVLEGRISRENNWTYDLPSSTSLVRTILGDEEDMLPFKFMLLRVLAGVQFMSHEHISQHVNLRYLHWSLSFVKRYFKLPSSVSLLWNVQTLKIIGGHVIQADVPSEIWYMRQLRHLQFVNMVLPDPPPPSENVEQQDDDVLLPNLQTLSGLACSSFTERDCKRIPNIKKLSMNPGFYCVGESKKNPYFDLVHLHKLQSLSFLGFELESVRSLMLPSSLRKLTLLGCKFCWEDINTIGLSLPHLEYFELNSKAVGPVWDCVEEAFPSLKVLQIWNVDLITWNAENSEFFPVLEQVHLHRLFELEKIPSGMGEIQTLVCFHVDWLNLSAAISLVEILEEQLSLGNDDFQLVVNELNEKEFVRRQWFRETVEKKNFASKNFKFVD